MSINKKTYKNVNHCLKCGTELILDVDKEDKLRPHCPGCGWIYYKNPIPAAACVILNSRNEIVVIKRAVEPNKGEWALPSGYIEIDQSPEQAASVEMKEETGLQGKVIKFSEGKKVPHIGWNQIEIKKEVPILKNIPENSFFYFVHSYYAVPESNEYVITVTDYEGKFPSIIGDGNIFGIQFHPEKSQNYGLEILKNFAEI